MATLDAHRELAEQDKWDCDVVIEDTWGVAGEYQAAGTPSGYLVDADGRIASTMALGGQALLELLEATPIAPPDLSGSGNGDGGTELKQRMDGSWEEVPVSATALKTRGVSESKIQRNGLSAGTIAPNFVLPDLEGKTRSLVEFRESGCSWSSPT